MKPFLIYGIGDFSDVVVDVIENGMQRGVMAYVVDQKYYKEAEYRGKPIFPFEEIIANISPEECVASIGFIGARMFQQRYKKYLELKEMGYVFENVIHPSVQISPTAKCGEANIFMPNVTIGSYADIGSCNVFCPNAYTAHNVEVGNANFFAAGSSMTGYVKVQNNCFFGINSAVNNKVTVADKTFVGGGIFITNHTAENDVYVPPKSVPLKHIRSIDFQMFTSRRNTET